MDSYGFLPPEVKPSYDLLSHFEYSGGTIVAIAGEDFAAVGADTLLFMRGMVPTRKTNGLFHLTNQSILGSYGSWRDTISFPDMLMMRVVHDNTIPVVAAAQKISELMYSRRLMPNLIESILVGLDSKGKGQVYSFDPMGHYEPTEYGACGFDSKLIGPLLDDQIGYKNRGVDPKDIPKMTKARAINLISDAFNIIGQCAEMNVDSVIIKLITKDGIEEFRKKLRK